MWQQISIIGNLGKDPELRYTPTGQSVCSFSVATSRQYTTNAGEKVKETVWFRVSTWGKQAEVCNQYLAKGSKVLIVGRLTADKSTGGPHVFTKQDGTNGASFEINAQEIKFLSPVSEKEQDETTPEGDMPF